MTWNTRALQKSSWKMEIFWLKNLKSRHIAPPLVIKFPWVFEGPRYCLYLNQYPQYKKLPDCFTNVVDLRGERELACRMTANGYYSNLWVINSSDSYKTVHALNPKELNILNGWSLIRSLSQSYFFKRTSNRD